MSAVETSNLCGSCHRTWQMVMLLNIQGVSTVRFQPYRLSLSQCFLSNDSRVACTACHDPHAALTHDEKAYDSKCTESSEHANRQEAALWVRKLASPATCRDTSCRAQTRSLRTTGSASRGRERVIPNERLQNAKGPHRGSQPWLGMAPLS